MGGGVGRGWGVWGLIGGSDGDGVGLLKGVERGTDGAVREGDWNKWELRCMSLRSLHLL